MPKQDKAPSRSGSLLIRRGLKMSHFRLFAALDQTGQISTAANELAISQPAASRLAGEAERIADAKLYRRTSHGIELTAAGRAFAKRARRMLMEIDETEREIAEIQHGDRGSVTIGSVTGPAVEHVLPAMRQARLQFPRISVNIEVATSNVLGEGLIEGTLDFILARLPENHDPRQFRARFVGPEPISLVVRTGHPLLRRPETAMNRLMEFDWVLPFEGTPMRTMIETLLLERGLSLPAKVLNTSSFLLTIVTVSQTNAIAPLASSVARFFAASSSLSSNIEELPVDLPMEVQPYALITANRELTPAARTLYDILAARL